MASINKKILLARLDVGDQPCGMAAVVMCCKNRVNASIMPLAREEVNGTLRLLFSRNCDSMSNQISESAR